jgi:mercuric ion binding protein
MNKILVPAILALVVLAPSAALAEQRTITLAVSNVDCADCPFIVKRSLERVPGVTRATVSFKDKTAVVVYDDGRTDVTAFTAATRNAGYPSAPKD